jgi:HAD superfamily hydrolase (TIGR01458 family)
MTAAFSGALIDIDGTLLHGDDPIPGAAQAIVRLRERRIPFRLSTNTTRRSRRVISEVLRSAGIDVAPAEIVAPSSLARLAVMEAGNPGAALLIPDAAREDFEGVAESPDPAIVVVGDLGRGFTFERLNEAFRWLRSGASLLALHRNPWWSAGAEGAQLDAGAFVAALEYASGVTARVVGKPSADFYRLAVSELGLPAGRVVSVGDSLRNDGLGAAEAGCLAFLVRTGVFDADELARSSWRPDAVLDSIAGFPGA